MVLLRFSRKRCGSATGDGDDTEHPTSRAELIVSPTELEPYLWRQPREPRPLRQPAIRECTDRYMEICVEECSPDLVKQRLSHFCYVLGSNTKSLFDGLPPRLDWETRDLPGCPIPFASIHSKLAPGVSKRSFLPHALPAILIVQMHFSPQFQIQRS